MVTTELPADSDLLHEYIQGRSVESFTEIVNRNISWIYNLALRQLRNSADAEDAAQAVFVLLLRKSSRFRRNQSLVPWLFQSTLFICRDIRRQKLRRDARERKAAEMQNGITPPLPVESDLLADLDEAIHRLSKADRRTILLRFFQQLSHEQIAAQLNISTAAAKMRTSRAVQKLRAALAPSTSIDALESAMLLMPFGVPEHLAKQIIAKATPPFIVLHSIGRASHFFFSSKMVVAAAIALVGSGIALSVRHSPMKLGVAQAYPATRPQANASRPTEPVYYILGTLKNPGVYPLSYRNNTIGKAIAIADPQPPLTASAFITRVHRLANAEEIYVFSAQSMMAESPAGPDFLPLDQPIAEGDTVMVGPNQRLATPIAAEDELYIFVVDTDQPRQRVEMHRSVSVSGDVQLPEVGGVHVAGQFLPEAERIIRKAYVRANVITSPMILVCKYRVIQAKSEGK
ncbi:MAG TPA: sigma-70 family RNA polymerase sigma factor [Tepidisphaeraceae bacterium]|jgi:RNA polymerase sigma factor (sigma-70 family)